MKQILKITRKISLNRYIGEDLVGKVFTISTDKVLSIGVSVLLINSVVVGIVHTSQPQVYDV